MPIHLYNLLLRSFFAVPTALGSTWIGLFFPLWGFLLAQVVILFTDGLAKMRTYWRQNVVRGSAVAGVAWATLFLWCVATTIYTDHVGLAARVGALHKTVAADAQYERDAVAGIRQDLGSQLAVSQQACAELKGANGALVKQAADQQGTINNCQTQALKLLSPEAQKMTVLTWEDKVTEVIDHKATYLLITNKQVTPVHIDGICNVNLSKISASPVGAGMYSGGAVITDSVGGAQRRLQITTPFSIEFSTPAWTPVSPIRMDITYTSSRTAICNFIVR